MSHAGRNLFCGMAPIAEHVGILVLHVQCAGIRGNCSMRIIVDALGDCRTIRPGGLAESFPAVRASRIHRLVHSLPSSRRLAVARLGSDRDSHPDVGDEYILAADHQFQGHYRFAPGLISGRDHLHAGRRVESLGECRQVEFRAAADFSCPRTSPATRRTGIGG